VLFAWHGYAIPRPGSKLELVGSITHITDDPRHRRLNDVVLPVLSASVSCGG
jgi:hypothetical protein